MIANPCVPNWPHGRPHAPMPSSVCGHAMLGVFATTTTGAPRAKVVKDARAHTARHDVIFMFCSGVGIWPVECYHAPAAILPFF